MLHRPVLKPHLHVEYTASDGVLLLSEHRDHVLTGPAWAQLIPLLTGHNTANDIVKGLKQDLATAEVMYLLMALEGRGLLTEAPEVPPPSYAGFWAGLGVDPASADARVANTTIRVSAIGGVPTDACSAALAEQGFTLGDGGIQVVLVDSYFRRELETINAAALRTGQTWMLMRPVGTEVWIGPLIVAGKSACWECVAHRLRLNRPVESYLLRNGQSGPQGTITRNGLPATLQAAISCLVVQLAAAVGTRTVERLSDAIITYDTVSLRMDRHPVTRRPQCPACGDATRFTRQAGEPIVLQRRASDLNWSSRDRIQPPDETMRQHQSVLDPLTGVVGNLRRCGSPDDDLLHVYAAAFHGAVHSSTSTLARSLQAGSGGKGMTDAHARASAVGESIEHYSGAFQGDEPQALAALDELGDAGIHPNRCMLISEYQYHCQEEHNRRPSDRNSIPARFDPSARISWTPIWSLTHQSHRYLPTKYLYFGCPSVEEDGIAAPDSNGNAAGNTIEEAILHGLLELVERDSVALWWYNRVQRPQVELAAMELEYVARLLNRYRSLGRELWVLDLTSDLGIPVFGAVSRRPDRTSEEILLGFGAHLDPGLAVIRALTEVNQLLVSVTTSKTTGAPLGPEFERWLACGSVSEHEYLLPGGYGPPLLQAEGAMPGDLLEAIGLCQTRIEDRGMEVLVLDQTRPDLMFPSVKVVVPGLRSFRPRFAPGRLYDGPVAAGWISTAVTESGLNQLPFFL